VQLRPKLLSPQANTLNKIPHRLKSHISYARLVLGPCSRVKDRLAEQKIARCRAVIVRGGSHIAYQALLDERTVTEAFRGIYNALVAGASRAVPFAKEPENTLF
jgi:tRNA A37 N6-isopentenylltransferase MiaA